jgi:cytochrome c peroxidase
MQALGPIENNLEHNFSRVAVAKRLASAYKSQYENLFHIIPNYVEALPEIGPPLQPKAFVPLTVTAYALATLGSSQSLKAILKTSQSESLQPAEYLAQIGSRSLQSDDAFAQLSDVEQHTINQMFANFGTALAAFQSTIISKDSPFDLFAEKFIANQTRDPEFSFNARFGASEFAGLKIFLGQGQCTTCHTGPNFTDQQFHNIGLADLTKNGSINLGRSQGVMQVLRSPFNCKGNFLKLTKENQTESCLEESFINTESTEFVGAFKTPSLRNVAETAPYMHDGSFATLEDVLRHYNKLEATPAVGHREETLKPLNLNKKELEQLKAFLTSLSGQVSHQ